MFTLKLVHLGEVAFLSLVNSALIEKIPKCLKTFAIGNHSETGNHSVTISISSNARARDAKLDLSFKTLTKYRALSDLLRSLIVSRVPWQMLSIA